MAKMLTEEKIPFDRDWDNLVRHNDCTKVFKSRFSRPDFRLTGLETVCGAIVLLCLL